jgi:hypothetical protein
MSWEPIETAPRHDRSRFGSTNQPRVLATDGAEVFEARHYDGDWYRQGERVEPTHWMPLPAPPRPNVFGAPNPPAPGQPHP